VEAEVDATIALERWKSEILGGDSVGATISNDLGSFYTASAGERIERGWENSARASEQAFIPPRAPSQRIRNAQEQEHQKSATGK